MPRRIPNNLMTQDSSSESNEVRGPRKRSIRPQVSLSTILLGTAVVAVWIAYANALKETQQLQARLPGLRRIAGELRMDDPRELSVVQRLPTKYDELIWDVHVPDPKLTDSFSGSGTQICLALDEIPPQLKRSEVIAPLNVAMLDPGRHSIELRYARGKEDAELMVLVDGEPQITVTRANDWESGKGWSSTNVHTFDVSESFTLDEPLVLLNRRFTRDLGSGGFTTPDEPSEGILLWVQRAEALP